MAIRKPEKNEPEVTSGNERCPWCHGTHWISVVDAEVVKNEDIMESLKTSMFRIIPKKVVCCHECHPEGMSLKGNNRALTLRQYLDKIFACYTHEYLRMVMTHLYLDLRISYSPAVVKKMIDEANFIGLDNTKVPYQITAALVFPETVERFEKQTSRTKEWQEQQKTSQKQTPAPPKPPTPQELAHMEAVRKRMDRMLGDRDDD